MNARVLRDRLILNAAPCLLVLVALLQVYRAHAFHQSPWKGGGFGMFASLEQPRARFLRCYVITPSGEARVAIPESVERRARIARVIPTRKNVAAIAAALAGARWARNDRHLQNVEAAASGSPETAGDPRDGADGSIPRYRVVEGRKAEPGKEALIDIDAVRVELWRYRFSPRDSRITAGKWIEITRRKRS